jgi:hypothetical protein
VETPSKAKGFTDIFETNGLSENSVISILETTAADGKNYNARFYNLDTSAPLRASFCIFN